MDHELKSFWARIFDFDWKFGLFLIFIVCIPRIALVLHGNVIGNMKFVGMTMLVMAIAPFVFLNRHGRKRIGISKPVNFQ